MMGQARSTLANKTFLFGVFCFIALLPMNWIRIAEVGLTVRPSHIAVAIVGLAFVLSRLGQPISLLGNVHARRFVVAVLCYLGAMMVAMVQLDQFAGGFTFIAKQLIFFLMFLLLAEMLIVSDVTETQLGLTIYLSVVVGLVIFIGSSILIFAHQGINLPVEYASAVVAGDTKKLQFNFYPKLFSSSPDDFVSTSLRNSLCTSFCIYLFLIQAFRRVALRSMSSSVVHTTASVVSIVCVFLVITSVSRSCIIILLLGIGIGAIFRRTFRLTPRTVFISLGSCLALLIVTAALSKNVDDIVSGFSERFENLHENPRIDMYREAIDSIANDWAFGKGPTAGVNSGNREQQVHNLFIASWYEAGILGLLAAILLYFAVLASFVSLLLKKNWPFDVKQGWLAALALLPLIRSQLSGQGGSFQLNEWVALSLLLSFIALTQNARAEDRVHAEDAIPNCQSVTGPVLVESLKIP